MLNKAQETLLHNLVYKQLMFFSRDKLFQYIQKNHFEFGISRRMVSSWLATQKVYKDTKQPVPPKKEKQEHQDSIDISKDGFVNIEIYEPELMDKGYNFALLVLDLATRRLFIEPIKQKTPSEICSAFKKLVKTNSLRTLAVKSDDSTEFKGDFQEYLSSQHIKHITSDASQPWSNPVNRYKKTIKNALEKYFLSTGKTNWIAPLTQIVENLNETWSRSLKTTPNDAQHLPEQIRIERLKTYGVKKQKKTRMGKTAFLLGDMVHIRATDDTIYLVSNVSRNNNIVQYRLTEDGNKHVKGTFDLSELVRVDEIDTEN